MNSNLKDKQESSGLLEPIAFAKNIWIADGPDVRDMGVMFTTRMTIVKLSDSSLWLESPVSVPFETLKRITALGPVRYLVAIYAAACLAARTMALAISRSAIVGTTTYSIHVEQRTPDIHWRSERHAASRLGK